MMMTDVAVVVITVTTEIPIVVTLLKTAGEITMIMTATAADGDGMAIMKAIQKHQAEVGKIVDTEELIPTMIAEEVMLTGMKIMVAEILIMTEAGMMIVKDQEADRTVTAIQITEIPDVEVMVIHKVILNETKTGVDHVEEEMMEKVVDGLVIMKDIQKLQNADGKTEAAEVHEEGILIMITAAIPVEEILIMITAVTLVAEILTMITAAIPVAEILITITAA